MARFLNSPSLSRQRANSNTTGTEVTFPEPWFLIPTSLWVHASNYPLFTLLNPTLWFFSVSLWLGGTQAPLAAASCLLPAVEHVYWKKQTKYEIMHSESEEAPYLYICECWVMRLSAVLQLWTSCMLPIICWHFFFLQSSQCPLVAISTTGLIITLYVRRDDDDVTGVTKIAVHVARSEMCLVKLGLKRGTDHLQPLMPLWQLLIKRRSLLRLLILIPARLDPLFPPSLL